MRIDKFLYFARLTRTRSAAQALIATGHLRLDGKRIERDAHPVAVGQVLTIPRGDTVLALRILVLPTRRGPLPKRRHWSRMRTSRINRSPIDAPADDS